MKKFIKLDFTSVADYDVSFIERWYPFEYNRYQINKATYFKNGMHHGEHYKLLGLLSRLYKNCNIIDGGTSTGISALALGESRLNNILSYDLVKVSPNYKNQYNNISFVQKDLLSETPEVLLSCPLILLDLDPHDGIQETKFFDILRKIEYQGIIILDDISTPKTHSLFPGMTSFWNSIPENKWDISKIGHGSGTGLVAFNMDVEIIIPEDK